MGTYIPRYEYKIWSNSQYVEVKFIRASQKEADAGYTLPDSFTFGGQDLAGFWISKYEVQEAQETVPQG